MTAFLPRLAAVLLFCIAASPLSAQSCTANLIPGSCTTTRTMSITIRRTVRVTVTPTVAALPGPVSADLLAGFSTALGQTVLVKSTSNWQLGISSAAATWTGTGGARINKPRADLLWGTTLAGPFNVMTAVAGNLGSGGQSSGTSINVYYRVLWSWTLDTPGTYTIPIIIRVTAP